MQVFRAQQIFDGEEIAIGRELVVEDGRVTGIRPRGDAKTQDITELGDCVIAPGFVDLQTNGAAGVMLNDAPTIETIELMCRTHASTGTTALLPTLMSSSPEVTRAAIDAGVAAAARRIPGFTGLHLEGPHLDPRRKGAHDPRSIRPMGDEDLSALIEAAAHLPTLMVTVAPEAANLQQISAMAAAGIIVSLGHSNASFDAAQAAFDAGATNVTHLFNAMSQLGSREPGMVGAALSRKSVFAGLIADGVHVHPSNVALAAAGLADGEGGIVLLTDSMACFGTDLQSFRIGGQTVSRRHGSLRLDDGTLAGADLDLPSALRNFIRMTGLDLAAGLAAITRMPARAIGRYPGLGSLTPGSPATFCCLTEDFQVRGVWCEGRPTRR